MFSGFNPQIKVTSFFVALAVVGLGGCSKIENDRVECNNASFLDPNGDTIPANLVYCVNRALCNSRTAAQICAYNALNDELATGQFVSADFAGTCSFSDGSGILEGLWPQTACDGDPPSTTANPSGSGGSSTSGSGDPTGGDLPTTGGSTTEAPEPEDPIFLCSLLSDVKCADLDPDNGYAQVDPYPNDSTKDACWVKIAGANEKKKSKCAQAPNVGVALDLCQTDCQGTQNAIEKYCADQASCEVDQGIDCVLDGNVNNMGNNTQEPPSLLADNSILWECVGELLVPKDDESNSVGFEAAGSLILSDGSTAGASAVYGYLGYFLSNCTVDECTVVIDGIEGVTRHVGGFYTDGTGASGSYALEEFGFHAASTITGTWHKARGTITFPNSVLDARFWADTVEIEGIHGWVGYNALEIDQIVGSLPDEDGPLTLNFTYNWGFGTASMSLRTFD